MRIELHIDRVILDGLGDPRQTRQIREALHAELSRLITAAPRTTWHQSRRQRRITPPSMPVDSSGSPTALGRSIANMIHSGLTAPGYAR